MAKSLSEALEANFGTTADLTEDGAIKVYSISKLHQNGIKLVQKVRMYYKNNLAKGDVGEDVWTRTKKMESKSFS